MRITTRNGLFLLACIGALLAPTQGTFADGLIIVDNPTDVPPGHFRFAPMEVHDHHVQVQIKDQVAVTEINQTFYNPHNRRLEGTYIFPIPSGAQIDKFSMDINGAMVEAELLDAARARSLYEDIVRKMRDPALLEYAGQGLFKVRIFPIEPHSEKKVHLQYTQLLHHDSGMTEYRYPLNTEKFSSSIIQSVSMKCEVTSSQRITTLYCPSHEVEITRPDEMHAVIGFEASNVRPDKDFQLYFAAADSASSQLGFSVLTYRPDKSEPGFFMMLAAPSVTNRDELILPKDVVFVLDTSGSMAGNNLEQAQNALRFCVANLNKGDRFDIVRFSTETEPLFDHLVDASKDNREKADRFLDTFQARGGTDINSALSAALDSAADRPDKDTRPFMIIFLTDGKPTVGTTDVQQIVDDTVKKLGDRARRIFCFGIGTDINTHLLDKIADATRATTEYVLPDEDIEVKVSNFYSKVDSPELANPKLTVQGPVRFSKMQPRDLPDVFKGEQMVVFGRYEGSGDAALTIDGVLAGGQRSIVYETSFPESETDNNFIARLWATRRVGWLLDEIRLHGENDELKDDVTLLAKTYGIVTPYTAYLILEDEKGLPVAFRNVPALNVQDARQRSQQSYGKMRREVTGEYAVTASKAAGAMKNQGSEFGGAGGGLGGGGADEAEMLGFVAQEGPHTNQPVRYVNGRTFYFNGEAWIDSTITDEQANAAKTIEFGTDAYFDLLTAHPDAAAWLALGTNMHIRLDDTVYVIEPAAQSETDDDTGS